MKIIKIENSVILPGSGWGRNIRDRIRFPCSGGYGWITLKKTIRLHNKLTIIYNQFRERYLF